MVSTCTVLSSLPRFRTAQTMPRGMVMARARIVTKILMKMVLTIRAGMT